MSVGGRIAERLAAIGMSQSELARRVSLAQTTINSLVRKDTRSSVHLHKIARVLGTTPAYLAGEIDDPAVDAPPPAPAPPVQIMMPITLPPVEALQRGFLAVLTASRQMDEVALAHELAVRLPTLLAVLQGPLRIEAAPPAPAEAPPNDHRERQRA